MKLALEHLQQDAGSKLAAISQHFKPGVKITLLVRTPTHPDGSRDFMMTDDDLNQVNTAILLQQRFAEKPAEARMDQYRTATAFTRAQQHRLHYVLDILDGHAGGVDYDLLAAGIAFARDGATKPYPGALIELFASPHCAAKSEGEWQGDPDAQAVQDIDQLMGAQS